MTLQKDKIHFSVMAIEAAAEKSGIPHSELFRRLERLGLTQRLLWDCYETMHSQSIEHVAEDVIMALNNWEEKEKKS